MKKDFKAINPANAFLTPEEQQPDMKFPEYKFPEFPEVEFPGFKFPDAKVKETKSTRLNLVIKPSTAENLRKVAAMHQVSINGLINLVLEDYLTREAVTITRYNAVFEKGE